MKSGLSHGADRSDAREVGDLLAVQCGKHQTWAFDVARSERSSFFIEPLSMMLWEFEQAFIVSISDDIQILLLRYFTLLLSYRDTSIHAKLSHFIESNSI
jgi:hypothetical protein